MPSSNVCWGIDIGAGAIKALKLERVGDNVRVDDFVVVPHKKVLSTPELNEADAMRVALGALMAEYGESMRGEQIAVAIPGHSSFARFAKLPPVEPKGVANLVRFEAVQQIPFPIDQVEWDYQVFASEDTPDIEVGIFAVTREKVNERLHLYAELGLRPDHITLGPVSVYNAIAYDLGFTEKTPGTIILDIGTMASDLIIAEGGKVWIRTFPLGGHHFTEALAETFKLSYSKAEKLKREAETSKYKRHIFQALKPILSDLVQDVQRSIGYYQDTHPDAKLQRLIGIGSTFKLLGLRKLLSQQMKIDVYRLESFKRISVDGPGAVDFEAASLGMVTAYGLALQGLGLTPINANLMPLSIIRETVWKRKTPWFVAAAAVGILGASTSFLRPFLDSQGVAPIGQDPVIRGVVAKGQQLKQEWQQVSSQYQPKFRADNIKHLLEHRDLYFMLLADVNDMLAKADAKAKKSAHDGRAFDLYALETRYIPPGGSMPTPASAASGASGGAPGGVPGGRGANVFGGRPGEPGGAGGGLESGAGAGATPGGPGAAGDYGAIEVTLSLTSANDGGKVFFNDTILEWLRDGVDQTKRPYSIVSAPTVADVDQEDVTGSVFRSTTPGFSGGMRSNAGTSSAYQAPTMGGRGAQPYGGQRGAEPISPGSAPGRGTGAGQQAKPGTLAELAPLEPAPPLYPEGKKVYRYTVSWVLQLKEKPAPAADKNKDAGSQANAGDGEVRS